MASAITTINATVLVKGTSSAETSASKSISSDQNETVDKNQDKETRQNSPVLRSSSIVSKKFIPPEELDQLLDKVDIVALIESYGLPGFQRTSSDNAKCLCPFHDDRNPSLQINGERGIYKCFSCGAGGNALKFVREYSERFSTDNSDTNGNKNTPLTFREAARALEEFAEKMPMVGGVPRRRYQSGSKGSGNARSTRNKKSSSSLVGTTSRERILHANLFAAAYYEESLFGLPSAGLARTHLRSRGILPTTVKAFAIGFAPESYFFGGERRQQQQQQKHSFSWGEGSLVHRLREEGFTPQEILDAGLATLTKKGKEQQNQSSNKNSDEDKNESGDEVIHRHRQQQHRDFSTIMDRFRGRLVVPIFDATGTHVLGFGGRVLETSEEASPNFKAAKYLNSPESLVFQKKELLFGQHMMKFVTATDTAISTIKSSTTTAAQRRPRSLIVVEGYMDAIALWQAGVKETVASMGTALTQEQLLAAASAARLIGGRMVLCLDNDNAGVAAVTRLCAGSNPILLSVTEQSNIEFFVANLPESVKDPAEFLEENQEAEDLDEKFRAEVIDEAQEWTKWHMNCLVAAHDPSASTGEDGSFSQIFDKLASFLSVFENVDDRMKKAAFIAPKLSGLVDTNEEKNKNDIDRIEASSTARIQLASNLVEKAANIAHSKSISAQRNYQFTFGSTRKEPLISKSLEISQDIALAEGVKNEVSKPTKSQTSPHLQSNDNDDSSRWQDQKPPMQRQRAQMKRRNPVKMFQKPMTKHIAGVAGNPLDDEWLGVTKDKYTNERNPLRYELNFSSSNQKYVGPETSVRFNKNNYHGTWTTPDATAAGYNTRSNSKSLDFLDKGTSSLIESNEEERSSFVEDLLFSTLVRFSEARKSLYESIQITKASGIGENIQWSAPEKEWLFMCLVEEINDIPQGIVGLKDLSALRSYLSARPDVFPGALSSTVKQIDESSLKSISSDTLSDKTGSFSAEASRDETDERSREHEKIRALEGVPNHDGDMEFPVELAMKSLDSPKMNMIPKIPAIPAIGEEWSGFAQTEGYTADDVSEFREDAMCFSDVDDSFMDSVGPIDFPESELDGEASTVEASLDEDAKGNSLIDDSTLPVTISTVDGVKENLPIDGSENTEREAEIIDKNGKSEILDAKFVVTEDEEILAQEGSLDRLFMDGLENYDIFGKFYADEDTMSLGSNEDKANWAVQDLYTMLQFTSLLKRVEAGRNYMEENNEDWLNRWIAENSRDDADGAALEGIDPSSANANISTIPNALNEELSEYCLSRASDGGLRRDLQRLRTLAEKNNQATNRILAMMEADFADRSVDVRGYSWLGNVLKFNEIKMVEWNDVIESKENFRPSFEGLEDLENIIYSDWNELSDPEEMYEFDKNVDLTHRSHFADLVIDRPDSECAEDFTQRVEDEWDVDSWEQEHDEQQDVERNGFDRYDDQKDESSDEHIE